MGEKKGSLRFRVLLAILAMAFIPAVCSSCSGISAQDTATKAAAEDTADTIPETEKTNTEAEKTNTEAATAETAKKPGPTKKPAPTLPPIEPVAKQREDALRIMTYNCLTSSKADVTAFYEYGGRTRGEKLRAALETYYPDSIGLQEITDSWEEYIEENIAGQELTGGISYGVAGIKSDCGLVLKSGSSEYSPILYRSDLYEVEKEGGAWLSETPDIPSKYDAILNDNGQTEHPGMKFNRVFSYCVLKSRESGKRAYIHVNTHFDHKSDDYINIICAGLLTDKVKALTEDYGCPAVITGDFNTDETTGAYAYLADSEHGFVNAKYEAADYSKWSSFPGFGDNFSRYKMESNTPIDHIFVSVGRAEVYKHDLAIDKYLSDHSGVYVDLAFTD